MRAAKLVFMSHLYSAFIHSSQNEPNSFQVGCRWLRILEISWRQNKGGGALQEDAALYFKPYCRPYILSITPPSSDQNSQG